MQNAAGPNKRVITLQINLQRPLSFLQVQSKRANSVCGPGGDGRLVGELQRQMTHTGWLKSISRLVVRIWKCQLYEQTYTN